MCRSLQLGCSAVPSLERCYMAFTSSRPTQGLPHHLAPLRAFHVISPHSEPSTSSRPTQGLSHHLAPIRAFSMISPHSGPSTSSRPTHRGFHFVFPHSEAFTSSLCQGLSFCLFVRVFHFASLSGPSTSSRPTQDLSSYLAPFRVFHIISPFSVPFTSSQPTQALLLPLAFHFVSFCLAFLFSH